MSNLVLKRLLRVAEELARSVLLESLQHSLPKLTVNTISFEAPKAVELGLMARDLRNDAQVVKI